MEQINTIYLLVHPLFEYEYGNKKQYPAQKRLIQSEMHNYGKFIQRAAKNKNALLIYVDAGAFRQTKVSVKRLEEYAKKQLGKRFFKSGYSFAEHQSPEKSGEVQKVNNFLNGFVLSKKITIFSHGQTRRLCVAEGTLTLNSSLKKKNISTRVIIMRDVLDLEQVDAMLRESKTGKLSKFWKWRKQTYGKRNQKPGRGNIIKAK